MNKKSLIFWFAAVTCAALFLVGCESPTNGDAGAAGAPGAVPFNDGDVSSSDLQLAFALSNNVLIGSGAGTVFGEIPAGKTLYIAGNHAVKNAESLDVQGTLDISEGAALNAGYVSTVSGYLTGTGTINGAVALPYFGAGVTGAPAGIVTYNSPNAPADKSVGGYVAANGDASSAATALDVAGIKAIFGLGENALSVGDLSTAIDAATVPAGKTLTVNGEASIEASLDLSSAGTLIVNGTLTASTGITITGKAADPANITVNGTLALASTSTALTIAGKVDLTEATIDATDAGAATLTLPTVDGVDSAVIGAIAVGSSNDLTIAGATGVVVGSITSAGSSKGVKSASVLKYYAAGTSKADYVGLGSAAADLVVTGLAGSTFDVTHAAKLASALTIAGAAKVKGALTDETGANFALTTANLAKLVSGSSVTYDGNVTGIGETLVIPEGITVDSGASGTLATITGLQVDGTLTAGDALALTALTDGTKITGTGTLTAEAVATDKAVLIIESSLASASLATTTITASSGLTIPANTVRTFTGAAAPSGNVTVNGTVIVATGGSLVIDTGKSLTAGLIALGPGTWLASGANTTIAENVITLGNNGGAKFGKDDGTNATVLTGTANATNTFTASGGTVTLGQSTNKLTITGSAAPATLTTGATAGIGVKAGLDITTATVDISAADTSVINLVDDDATGITLANANSVILLDGNSATAQTETKKTITGLTVGVNVEVWAVSDAGNVSVGKFVGAASANTIKESDSGFDIKKGIKTAS